MNDRQLFRTFFLFGLIFFAPCFALTCIAEDEVDTDSDGLSDFHETHKYLTNPNKADSDGDGTADGDWLERREYQYTVRSVVHVMKPVTPEYLNDDYQDVRVLDETDNYVELEVIHYPMNTVASTIKGDKNWRQNIKKPDLDLAKWLEPGPTSDWTPELAKEIREALAKDGINLDELDDKTTVEKVSRWLLQRAEYQDGFSCFCTAFDENGDPFIPDELKPNVGRNSDLTLEQQWEIEISASGMFRNKKRGSCSSSAIYINGCMRAVGIPTRTILCIPIVDAGDENEMTMIGRLKQPTVRSDLMQALAPLKNSWASHTYNEVFVGGRWRRLNYDRLGQNIYDPGMFGLMTHVATFHDWADAKMHETVGRRHSLPSFAVFGGANPYSTISLRDEVGKHCTLKMPEPEKILARVEQIHWTDSDELPDGIVENCRQRNRFGFIADVTGFKSQSDVRRFLAEADMRVYLEVVPDDELSSEKQATNLGIGFEPGCYWYDNGTLRIYVPFGTGDRQQLVLGAKYLFKPRNAKNENKWLMPHEISVVRKKAVPQ